MIAAVCPQAGRFELREVALPVLQAGDALVRVHSCGICGSDLHYFHGTLPPPPVCPGHEISGEVVEVRGYAGSVRADDRVAVEPLVCCRECSYCRTGNYQLCRELRILGTMQDGGFAEYVRVPAYALFPLPTTVDPEVGALTEPLAVAVHGVRIGGVRPGDRVAVLGAGTIGLLAVLAAKAGGAGEVWITARHPQQRAAATALGATRVFSGFEAGSELSANGRDHPIDVVVESVGGAAGTLGEAVELVRPGGTVVVLGVFATAPPVNALALVVKEVRVVGSLTYGRPGLRADFEIALDLLAQHGERVRPLITHRTPLGAIAQGFATAADKRSGAIKVLIQPE